MKTRLLSLCLLYIGLLCAFALQKPLFMLYNGSGYGFVDYCAVMWRGLSLDMTMAAYLIALPWLAILVDYVLMSTIVWRSVRVYIYIVGFVMALAFVVDASLYSFWNYKLDATVLTYLSSPREAFASVSFLYICVGLVGWLALGWLYGWAMNYCHLEDVRPRRFNSRNRKKRAPWGYLLTLVVMGGLLFLAIRGGWKESTANVGQVYYSDDQFLNQAAVNPLFSFFSSLGKKEDFAAQYDFFDEAERRRLMEGLYADNGVGETTHETAPAPHEKPLATHDRPSATRATHGTRGTALAPHDRLPAMRDTVLNTERPHVLLIILEGFGTSLMDYPEVAPNLNELAQEGLHFAHCYANSFRTDRGLVSLLSGHPGLPRTSIMKIPAKSRALPCLAGSMANAGYSTQFIYGGDINFTSMQGYLRTGGYQRIIADKDFPLKEQNSSKWGVHDEHTFARLYDLMQQYDKDTRTFTTLLTLSSHEPFEVPYQRLKEAIPNAFAYTDHHLGMLIRQLKQLPLWDELLVIITADHGFYFPEGEYFHSPRYFQVPMLWLGGALRHSSVSSVRASGASISSASAAPRAAITRRQHEARISQRGMQQLQVMNQSDLPATLLSQLGIPHGDYLFSRDVLSADYKYPFAIHAYNDGVAFIDSAGYVIHDNTANRVILETNPATSDLNSRRAKAILQTLHDDLARR